MLWSVNKNDLSILFKNLNNFQNLAFRYKNDNRTIMWKYCVIPSIPEILEFKIKKEFTS